MANMCELAKSVIGTTWALSLLGAQCTADSLLLRQQSTAGRKGSKSLDEVSRKVRSKLSSRLDRFFESGDDVQRGMVDLAGAAVGLDLTGLIKPSMDVVNPLVEAVGIAAPRTDWLVDWQELRNKFDVFDLVRNVERRLNVSDGVPISELVDRACDLGDFHALWAVEGLGHYYAKQSLRLYSEMRGMLFNPVAIGLPEKSLPMMNAGIGLAFAERLLSDKSSQSSKLTIDSMVAQFEGQCRANATPGYVGCALESLGLVTRSFHQELLSTIDRSLVAKGDEKLLGFFWHGAGRGSYFALSNFVPCGGVSWTKLVQQAPHETARKNLVSGQAWAITLVNMKTPHVMERLLRTRREDLINIGLDAFANGVSSSIAMRQETTPAAKLVDTFCSPANVPAEETTLWYQCVQQPCTDAAQIQRFLKQNKMFGELFQFHLNFNHAK